MEWRAAGLEGRPPDLLRQCTEMLRTTKNDIKQLGKDSFQRREQERKQKIESLTSSNTKSDLEQAKRLRYLQKAEAIKNLFRKLACVKTH